MHWRCQCQCARERASPLTAAAAVAHIQLFSTPAGTWFWYWATRLPDGPPLLLGLPFATPGLLPCLPCCGGGGGAAAAASRAFASAALRILCSRAADRRMRVATMAAPKPLSTLTTCSAAVLCVWGGDGATTAR